MRNYPSVHYRAIMVRTPLNDNQQIACHLYSVDDANFFAIIAMVKLRRAK